MTARLYYHDADLLDFQAIAIGYAGDAHRVVLDRTAFYPTSGGQPHDTGQLGAAHVVDVIDEEHGIVHVTDLPVPLGPVHGLVDGQRRRDHMQQHTAQHLLSALAADRYEWATASVHFGSDHSTIEFASPTASEGQLAQLEQWANEIVAAARPVTVCFEDAVVAERAGLRKPSGRTGEIRVVTIVDLDRSACGGTHVSRTSEIGPVLLLGVEKLRAHVRVGFLAGDRVLIHARAHDAMLSLLAREMNCARDDLMTLMPARQQELKLLRDSVSALEEEVAVSRLRAAVEAATPGADGLRRVRHRANGESPALVRAMARATGTLQRALFAATVAAPPTIYFATSADSEVDASARLRAALAAAGGRGGGSARLAQGTAPTSDALDAVADGVLNA